MTKTQNLKHFSLLGYFFFDSKHYKYSIQIDFFTRLYLNSREDIAWKKKNILADYSMTFWTLL